MHSIIYVAVATTIADLLHLLKVNLVIKQVYNTFSDIFDLFLQDRSTEEFLDCDICDSRFSTKDSLKNT